MSVRRAAALEPMEPAVKLGERVKPDEMGDVVLATFKGEQFLVDLSPITRADVESAEIDFRDVGAPAHQPILPLQRGDRRFGKFTIPQHMIDDDPAEVARLLSGLIVLDCRYTVVANILEYVALNPAFDPVPPGEGPPHYTCIVHVQIGQPLRYEWKKNA